MTPPRLQIPQPAKGLHRTLRLILGCALVAIHPLLAEDEIIPGAPIKKLTESEIIPGAPIKKLAESEIIPGAPTKKLAQGVQQTVQKTSQLITPANNNKKTRIRIRGLSYMSEEQALGLLGNMIDHVLGHSPSPSRADDAAFLLELTLRRQGLPEAQVDWTIPKRKRTIILNVNQGPVRHIGEVFVSGVDPAMQEELATYFKNEPFGFNPLKQGLIPYIPSQLEESEENATSHMHAAGYWDAKVTLSKTTVIAEQEKVNLGVTVRPGPLYLLTLPELRTPERIDLNPLRQKLGALVGLPASTDNIQACRQAVKSHFLELGYAFTSVEMSKRISRGRMQLIFTINHGQRYRIGNITIEGLERTDPFILERRFQKGSGNLYNPERFETHRRKFISTGAFSSFLVEPHPRNDGTIDMTLRIQEGRARGVATHLGVGSYEGAIFGLSYLDRNFRGKLQTLSISGEFSGLGLLGQASINDPMLFGSDLNGTLRTFILSHELEGYSKVEAGIGAELVWTVNDHYGLRFYGETLTARSKENGLPESELGYTDYTVSRFGITQRIDFRDNKVNPHRGFYAELLTEAGLVTGGSPIPYYKVEARTSYRQPIYADHFLSLSGRLGLNFNDDQTDYPIDLRFFLGGSDSVRSFPERELGPQVNGDSVGGEAYWIANVEYNHKVKGPVYLNLFADAGSLARDTAGLDTSDVHYAAGLGFWLDLPIGPVRAEYGYNLNRRSGEPAGTFHFTIGVSF